MNDGQIDEMIIVEHKDEMLILRSYLVDRRNQQRSNRRRLRSCQRLDQRDAAVVDGAVYRQSYIAPEVDWIVVAFVERQPRQRYISTLAQHTGCLQHCRRFAETRRGTDERQWYIGEMTQLCKNTLAQNKMASIGGQGNPGNEQRFAHETPLERPSLLIVLYRNSA